MVGEISTRRPARRVGWAHSPTGLALKNSSAHIRVGCRRRGMELPTCCAPAVVLNQTALGSGQLSQTVEITIPAGFPDTPDFVTVARRPWPLPPRRGRQRGEWWRNTGFSKRRNLVAAAGCCAAHAARTLAGRGYWRVRSRNHGGRDRKCTSFVHRRRRGTTKAIKHTLVGPARSLLKAESVMACPRAKHITDSSDPERIKDGRHARGSLHHTLRPDCASGRALCTCMIGFVGPQACWQLYVSR